jgi:mRNA deadenylase 3'-5' endonuclease subunit Ccr4
MDFGVLTYNILADYLAVPDYIHVRDEKHLDNKKRMTVLLKYLRDQTKRVRFFFLQELSPSQLVILVPFFREHGFDHFAVGDLATFFPREVGIFGIRGGQITDIMKGDDLSRFDPRRIRQYYSVIDLVWREKPFRLVNSHLVSSPELEAAKLSQAKAITAAVLPSPRFPVIWGGDFNSTPNSRVYAFLATKLRSVNPSEMFLTTHASNRGTPHFSETIDYIWFASPEFHCKEFIPPYTTPPNQYMPNEKQPSDHFPLVAIME